MCTTTGLYTDRYELAMAATYWREGRADEPAVFDYFFRRLPFDGGYAVFAGLDTFLEALEAFRFAEDEIAFLEADGFPRDFLAWLRSFRFGGSLWAPPEGEIVFPIAPVMRIEGGLLETQIVETLLLNMLNFQTLIATKAARCREVAQGRGLSEFGLRRAQGLGGRWATRAAAIGGFTTTSNLDAARRYGIDAVGTMAHAFIQSYDREIDAFRAFAADHGASTVLLLDTHDTLRSGVPNAIRVACEMRDRGEALAGVRLDSGDLSYLASEVRRRLDAEGLTGVKIIASNQLDETVIRSLLAQEAPIDLFGIGTAIATGAPDGALDGVYKLAATDGKPRLKASETLAKTTLPGRKQVTRYSTPEGTFAADAVHLAEETEVGEMVHPSEPQKRLKLDGWTGEPLLRPVLRGGTRIGPRPTIAESSAYAADRLALLPREHRRFEHPHVYKVGLSPSLHALRARLLDQNRQDFTS